MSRQVDCVAVDRTFSVANSGISVCYMAFTVCYNQIRNNNITFAHVQFAMLGVTYTNH